MLDYERHYDQLSLRQGSVNSWCSHHLLCSVIIKCREQPPVVGIVLLLIRFLFIIIVMFMPFWLYQYQPLSYSNLQSILGVCSFQFLFTIRLFQKSNAVCLVFGILQFNKSNPVCWDFRALFGFRDFRSELFALCKFGRPLPCTIIYSVIKNSLHEKHLMLTFSIISKDMQSCKQGGSRVTVTGSLESSKLLCLWVQLMGILLPAPTP